MIADRTGAENLSGAAISGNRMATNRPGSAAFAPSRAPLAARPICGTGPRLSSAHSSRHSL